MAAARRWAGGIAEHSRHVVLAALVAGLLLGPRVPAGIWAGAAVLTAAAGGIRAVGGDDTRAGAAARRATAVLVLAALALPLGGWIAQARLRALDHTALRPWLGHALDARSTLLQPPRARSFGRRVGLVRIDAGPGAGERVLVEVKGPFPGTPGDELRVRGGVRPLPGFEQAARRAGAHALIAADSVAPTGARRGGVLGALDGVRRRADAALQAGVPADLGGLARGMVLGEDDRLTPQMTADFRASGLAHLVAASGSNVALLAAMALALGALLGLPRSARLWLALGLVVAYVPLAGGGASIQRAGIMGVATLVAALASRPASRWYALLLAAAATLGLNPRAAEDPGWQLSFAAVAGLMLLAPPLRSWLVRRRVPGPLAEALAVCIAASAATAPLIATHFGRLSWVTVPANLLAAPAVAPVMWLGAAVALLGQASPALAQPLMTLAAWPLAFIAGVGHAAAHLPGARAQVHLSPGAAAACLAGLLALAVRRVRSAGRRLRGPVAALALMGLAVTVAGGAGPRPPQRLTISALDVGQGDATLIQDAGHAVLVDAGPPQAPIVQRLRAAGVQRLDLLVVTHAQADHDGGAAAVLGAFPVAEVLDGRDGVPSVDGDRMAAAAARDGAPLVTPAAGQRIRAGPIELDVLSPRPEPPAEHAGEDPNLRAIVAEVRDGSFTMLLTADAESDVLDSLPLEPVDVLKVSHHGSADPGLPQLLERLRPKVAIVEVGAHNPYGHPAPQTMHELDAAVPRVYRTDQDGTVRLEP